MKNSIKRAVALAVVAVMLLCMAPFGYAAEPDFIIAAGEVTGELGDSTVDIPLTITKMYDDEILGGITVEVNYDTDVFTFDKATGWAKGSMVVVDDDIIINTVTPGLIRIMFSSARNPITPEMVATDNLFGTVTLGIKDTTVAINETIPLTTNDDLYDKMANVLIPMDDMGASLKAGKVTIGDVDDTQPGDGDDETDKDDETNKDEEEVVEDITIVSADKVYLKVNTGLSLSTVKDKLPGKVEVTADAEWNNGSKKGSWEVVSWEVTGAGFAGNVEGEYIFEGTLASKTGYIIDTTVTAYVTVSKQQNNQSGLGGIGSSPVIGALVSDDDAEEEEEVEIRFVIGGSSFTMNGRTSYMDVAFMYNDAGDRTLVPVRFISEVLGYNVGWDDATDTVTITKDKHTIVLVIGSETMYVNGAAVQMDTAPVIYSDRTFVPIRFVAENFGLEVGFDEATQEVLLSNK